MNKKFTLSIAAAAMSLVFLAGATAIRARYVETSPVAPSMRGLQSGKGVVQPGYYSPIRNKNKVRSFEVPAADEWTKALPDSLMCMLLESDNTTFNPTQTGMYTFDSEAGLKRFLTTSNTARVRGGMAYGDLRLLWTYKNSAAEDNHVWYTRSYSVKKYAAGTLNLSDQKYLTFNDDQDQSMIASAMAYDPETGAVFGCFNDQTGTKYEFAKMDHKFVDNGRSKAIASIESPWQACGFTSNGQMYAVLHDGSLATVDKANGATAKVKDLGLAGNDSYAGFLDTRDDLFYIYWSNREKGEAALYVVDINNGCNIYKAFTMPFYAKMGSMVSLHNPVSNSAPGLATGTSVTFDGSALNGKFKFTAPAKTLDGQDLSGQLNYSVAANGKVLATGQCEAGNETEVNIALPEPGSYIVRVRLGNSAGVGLWSQPTAGVWAGPDVPVAPSNVSAQYNRDESVMNISWDAVEQGVHNGSVSSADVKYTVVKLVNGEVADTLAVDIPDLKTTETVAWPDSITTVKYSVSATYEGATGVSSESNSIILGTIMAPWSEDFSDANAISRFTVYNAGMSPSGTGNNTQNVWFHYMDQNGNGAAQIYCTSKKDHYLVTPAIYMEPGKSYIFHADASGFASSYEETVEVLMGTGNTIEALTTTLIPTTSVKAISSSPVVLFKEIQVEEAGEYYIAFHATSAAYKRYLQIDNIEIEAPYSTYGPNVITDLSLDGFRYDGSTNVTVNFKAPVTDMQGAKLTNMTKIEVERDGQVVKTFRNPTFGETYTFEDECPARGQYTYKVTAYNSFGGGKYVTGTAETGVDFGAKVTDLVISEPETGVINIKWTPATTDVKGREIDPSLIKYTVILNNQYYVGDEFHPNTVNELTFKAVNDGYQANCYCTIYSVTDAGYNTIGSYRYDPASYAETITLAVGTPYSMPVFENGQISVNWGYETSGGQWWGSWFPEWSVVNPSNSAALGIETPDGDGYAFAWPVAFNPNYGTEYSVYEGAKSNFYCGKVHVDDSELSAFSFKFFVQPEEDGKPADEYIFYPIIHIPYEEDVALSSPISTRDFTTPGWHTITVSLDKYRGQNVQPGLHVEFGGSNKQYDKYFLIDDIQIRQFADYDMMAVSMNTPMLEPGEENKLVADFRNIGYENADAFVVELYRNNEKVAESEPVSVKAGESGSVVFNQTPGLFWETLQNYHFNIAYGKDQLTFNNKSEEVEVEVLESRLPAIKDLRGEMSDDGVSLTWTAPEIAGSMTDDCEKYVPFSINRAGRWSFIDADGLGTYPIVGDQFPGFGEPSAFVVWNNIDSDRNFTHSGTKCFAAFPVDAQSDDEVNDDWLISPLLNGSAQTISFWALGNFGSSLWGSHIIEVLYSTTGKEIEDFTRVGNPITLEDKYTQYSFDVPEGTNYFAIRYVQAAVSAIFIDDITFAQFGNDAELIGYDIYCDGEKLNEDMITSTEFVHPTLEPGTYTYHVVALYKEGSSDLSNKASVLVSGIDEILTGGISVYTTPGTIHIDNADCKITVLNPGGMVIYSNSVPTASESVKVTPGVYVVTANGHAAKVFVKE